MEHLFGMLGVSSDARESAAAKLGEAARDLGLAATETLGFGALRLSLFNSGAGSRARRMWSDERRAVGWLGHVVHDDLPLWPDAEALAAELTSDSAELVRTLDGLYMLVVYDESQQSLLVGTDRLGIHPCYYAEYGDGLFFSSSLHMLIRTIPGPLHMDSCAAAEWLNFGFDLRDATFVKEIRRLGIGEMLTFNGSRHLETNVYFDGVLPGACSITDAQSAIDQLIHPLEAAVSRRLSPDHNTVLMLSGGNDSRLIAAILSRLKVPFETWTTNPDTGSADDIDAARMVSERLGVENRYIDVPDDYLQRYWREKCLRIDFATAMHTWMMPMASGPDREGCILLDGLGGDPFFRRREWRGVQSRLYRDGRREELLDSIMKFEGRGDVLARALGEPYRRSWYAWSRERLEIEMALVEGRSDPLLWYQLTSRVRRGIGSAACRVMGPVGENAPVFLDYDLFDVVSRIDPELLVGPSFQRRLIEAIEPGLANIPFAGDPVWPADMPRRRIDRITTTYKDALRDCFAAVEKGTEFLPGLVDPQWLRDAGRSIELGEADRIRVLWELIALAELAFWGETYGDCVEMDLSAG